jgi:hypothetical protein
MTITRRQALANGAAGLVAAAAAPLKAQLPAPAERPNILWLVSEDNYPHIGAYGDRLAHTPNIDRLAEEGVRFSHGYCHAPVFALRGSDGYPPRKLFARAAHACHGHAA